jgi:hypothetical protein
MWRPTENYRLPSWICVLTALAAAAFGLWSGSTGWAAWDQSDGYERLASAVLLILAAGSFVVAAGALMFARSGKLFWMGVIALFVLYAVGTQTK